MGQQGSKQKGDQIAQSLERIRKDVRNGKITSDDVDKLQEVLKGYSQLLNGDRNSRSARGYSIQELIDITSQELDALKQEVSVDQGDVATKSFRRSSSKNSSKKKRKSVKSVNEAVRALREEIRTQPLKKADFDRLQGELIGYSKLLSATKGKKTENDNTQKLISQVTTELLTKQTQASSLRRSSAPSTVKKPERASLTERRLSASEKRSSLKKEPPKITTQSTSTLDDINQKLETLKADMKVAETHRDKSRLHFLTKSVQILMTDLQLIEVADQPVKQEQKEILEKSLQRTYQQLDKIKRQITEESDMKYLVELESKQKRERLSQDLDDVYNGVIAISRNITAENFQSQKESLQTYKTKLEEAEGLDEQLNAKKSEISDVLLSVEKGLSKLEMEEKLNQSEWRHFQYKIDLKQFTGTTEGEGYKKHRQYLIQLRDYVNNITAANYKIEEKKKYVLYNIENNITALDHKAQENEKSKKPTEEVVMRRSLKTNKDIGNDLVEASKKLPTTKQDLQEIIPFLNEAKRIIEQKLSVLQDEQEVHLVVVHEMRTTPPLHTYQNVELQGKELTVPSPTPVVRTHLSASPKELTSSEDVRPSSPEHKEPPAIHPKPVRPHLDNIKRELTMLQSHIESTRYSTDHQLYKDIKNRLESYKRQIVKLCHEHPEEASSGENLLKNVDNLLVLLDNNAVARKSTTEDILNDIMSVSTRVDDLGVKIQNFNQTLQDYDSIKSSLMEHRDYLNNLQVASNRNNILQYRHDLVNRIDQNLSKLEEAKKTDNPMGSEEEKQFYQDLRKLKDKVSRYSGTYKNVLYKSIENDLDKQATKVDDVFPDSEVAVKVKEDIEKAKMILEQKSTKEQQIKRDVRESGGKELTEIRENVESVKKTLSQNAPLSKDDLEKLDARLTLSILALDNIRDDHCTEEKDKLYKDIHLYFDIIQELMVLTTSNSILVEQDHHKPSEEKPTIGTIMTKIERDLAEIKPQILSFVGTENSSSFLELDEILVRGTLKLDEMDLDPGSEWFQLKLKLLADIQKYSDILDERVNQTEQVERLENQVKVMLIKIDSFNGYVNDSEYMKLDEEIIGLKISLGKLEVNPELFVRKQACIREVDGCMKKLKEVAKPRTSSYPGTLV